MRKLLLIRAILILVGITFLGITWQKVSANAGEQKQNLQQATPTLIPTAEPIFIGEATPTPRVLPPVGSNAGIVVGAIVLVLIIIGGVLGVRRSSKH